MEKCCVILHPLTSNETRCFEDGIYEILDDDKAGGDHLYCCQEHLSTVINQNCHVTLLTSK